MLALAGLAFAVMLFLFVWDSVKNREVDEFGSWLGATAIVTAIAAIAGMLVINLPASIFLKDDVVLEYNLKAMQDGSSTTGSFFLGSGTINDVPSFMYYVEYDDGSVSLESAYASDSVVVETDENPRVTYECEYYGDIPTALIWPVNHFGTDGDYDCTGTVTFYVPENSVKSQYVLDAE